MKLSITETHAILNRPVNIEFEVYKSVLENMLEDSHDFKLFGYDTVEAFVEANNSDYNKEILVKNPYNTEMVSGGRLDILYRTHPINLDRLNNLYWGNNKEDSLLKRLADGLEAVDCDDESLEFSYDIDTVEDAILMLNELEVTV